jgi:hypothetical protein
VTSELDALISAPDMPDVVTRTAALHALVTPHLPALFSAGVLHPGGNPLASANFFSSRLFEDQLNVIRLATLQDYLRFRLPCTTQYQSLQVLAGPLAEYPPTTLLVFTVPPKRDALQLSAVFLPDQPKGIPAGSGYTALQYLTLYAALCAQDHIYRIDTQLSALIREMKADQDDMLTDDSYWPAKRSLDELTSLQNHLEDLEESISIIQPTEVTLTT